MLLFLDTETTGLPKYSATTDTEKWPRVVQLAWSLYDTDGTLQSQNTFIIYPTDFTIPTASVKKIRHHDPADESRRNLAAQSAPAIQCRC